MTIALLLVFVVDAAMTMLAWKSTADLLLLGYGFVAIRSWWLERRLNARDWDLVGEKPASDEDDRKLSCLEEAKNFGKNLDSLERDFVAQHRLGRLPSRVLWLLFATRAVRSNGRGVVVGSWLDYVFLLSTAAWVVASTVFVVGAHFGVHDARAIARLIWLPLELFPVAFVAYFFDLYLTHPVQIARDLGLRK